MSRERNVEVLAQFFATELCVGGRAHVYKIGHRGPSGAFVIPCMCCRAVARLLAHAAAATGIGSHDALTDEECANADATRFTGGNDAFRAALARAFGKEQS